jgi:hypothetical protein
MFDRKLFVLKFGTVYAFILAAIVGDEISRLNNKVWNNPMKLAAFVMKFGPKTPNPLLSSTQLPEILRRYGNLIRE